MNPKRVFLRFKASRMLDPVGCPRCGQLPEIKFNHEHMRGELSCPNDHFGMIIGFSRRDMVEMWNEQAYAEAKNYSCPAVRARDGQAQRYVAQAQV